MSSATADAGKTAAEVSYLAGVRAELTDLPPAETADVLDEVSAHLADLTAELGPEVDLTTRLGPPAAYAAELRAAAGYPPSPVDAAPPRRALARLALAALVASPILVTAGIGLGDPTPMLLGLLAVLPAVPLLLRDGPRVPAVAALPVVRRLGAARPAPGTAACRVVDFVAALQPGWWLVRAVLAAVAVSAAFGRTGSVPAVLLTIVGLPVSVWLGHLTRRDRRWLWVVIPLNAVAAALLVVILSWSSAFSADHQSSAPATLPGLWQDSERQILDIRPVDAKGTPLTGVYLFDQDGRPIDTSGAILGCDDQYGSSQPTTIVMAPYPRGTLDRDPNTGRCVVVPPGPLVVAVPAATATSVPTPTPTPTPAPTSAPSAGPTR